MARKKKPAKKVARSRRKKIARASPRRRSTRRKLGDDLLAQLNRADPDEFLIGFEKLTEKQKLILHALVSYIERGMREEGRRHSRIDTRLQVHLELGGERFRGETRDLSSGGMFMTTDWPLSAGDEVGFDLALPAGMPSVKGRARVVYAVELPTQGNVRGYGMQFRDLHTEGIRDYLEKRIAGDVRPRRDKRKYGRVKRSFRAHFSAQNMHGSAWVKDIGRGGVFLQTDEPPELGAPIEMTLVHPLTLQALHLSGKVVRVVPPGSTGPSHSQVEGIGVEFGSLRKSHRDKLASFLADFIWLENL
jgi:Tfp pilus assembly protein PilZ